RIIQRRFNYSFRNKTIAEVRAGNVIPIYSNALVLPTFIPIFLKRESGTIACFVNLGNHGTMKENVFDIDTRILFSLLQTGTFAREAYFNWNAVKMNSTIAKNASEVYCKLVSK